MSQVEEAKEVRDSRPVTSFEEAQEEARRHHAGEGKSGCLAGCNDAPAYNAKCGPDVGRDDFPHESEPFEDDVRDVEDCEEPLVVGGGEVELFLHACYLCVSGFEASAYDLGRI